MEKNLRLGYNNKELISDRRVFDIDIIKDKKEIKETPVYGNIYLYGNDEVLHHLEQMHISEKIMVNALEHKSARYENHEEFDIICIPKSQSLKLSYEGQCIHVFIQKDRIILVCEDTDELEQLIEKIKESNENIEDWRVIYDLFEKLLIKDQKEMELLEETIINLEDDILLRKKDIKALEQIVQYRKKLLSLKHYYERLTNIFSYIIANENQFLEKKALRYFKIQGDKVTRLYQNVLVLRDYVTQIREAYESEVDISLNKTMKLFTVIAAIFMPLTLVVGWYGMNFDMPEFHWAYGYPFVIGISCLCVISCIYLFKRNDWF